MSAGSVVLIVFGVLLGSLALCGGGLTWYSKKQGYGSVKELLNEFGVVGAYAPMGGGSQQGMGPGQTVGGGGGGMTFNSLRSEVSMEKSGGSELSKGGYVPPVLAAPLNDEDDDDEEDVALGTRSAVV
jgi:hypothetical protein